MPAKIFGPADKESLVLDPTIAVVEPDSIFGRRSIALRRIDPSLHTEFLGLGDGSETAFSATVLHPTLRPNSVVVYEDSGGSPPASPEFVATDDGNGAISDSGGSPPASPDEISGTVDYDTGAIAVVFVTPPPLGANVVVEYKSYRPLLKTEGGLYEKGTVTFPNWEGSAIRDLFGFTARELHEFEGIEVGKDTHGELLYLDKKDSDGGLLRETDLKYQLSNDGGATWQYVDLSPLEWATGDDTDATFSDWRDISNSISSFPWLASTGKKQLRIRARLFPSPDLDGTPRLIFLNVYHELLYDPEEDIKRSLKYWIEQNVNPRHLVYKSNLSSATSVDIDVSEGDEVLTYSDPIAYNLTDDPGRTTPLGVSVGSPEGGLDFDVAQTGTVEVHVKTSLPVFISEGQFTQLSTSRAVVIDSESVYTLAQYEGYPRLAPGTPGQSFLGQVKEPVGAPPTSYRVRPSPSMVAFDIGLILQSPRELQVNQMEAELRRELKFLGQITSLATGDSYARVIGNEAGVGEGTRALSSTEEDILAQGIQSRRIDVAFTGWAQEGAFDTIEAATVLKFNVEGDKLDLTDKLP